jgi:hypothetical protein
MKIANRKAFDGWVNLVGWAERDFERIDTSVVSEWHDVWDSMQGKTVNGEL